MLDIKRRKGFSNITVNELIAELARMPQNAIVTACGDINVWLHIEVDDQYLCIDCEDLEADYNMDAEEVDEDSLLKEQVLEIIESAGQNRDYDDVFEDLVELFRGNLKEGGPADD